MKRTLTTRRPRSKREFDAMMAFYGTPQQVRPTTAEQTAKIGVQTALNFWAMATINRLHRKPHSPRKDRNKEIYDKGYNTRTWRGVREAVLKRDNYLCQRCLEKGIVKQAEEVHHITPLSTYIDDADLHELLTDTNNCISLCRECHKEIHKEMKEKGLIR